MHFIFPKRFVSSRLFLYFLCPTAFVFPWATLNGRQFGTFVSPANGANSFIGLW